MQNSVSSMPPPRAESIYRPEGIEASSSGVSWAAIIGGAFVAAALSLILIALGTGLGFSSVSPWSNAGASATTVGIAGAIWLIIMQAIASGLGGYLAGRLRTKWVDLHTDEVFFRDTAHGFLAWAVATVITAAMLTSAVSSIVGGTAKAGASALSGAAGSATGAASQAMGTSANPSEYFVDTLFRSDRPRADENDAAVRTEVGRILAASWRKGDIAPADKTYLAQVVAARTGLSQVDAEQRVTQTVAQAKSALTEAEGAARQAADAARKAVAYLSLWVFVALLVGAFCASYAATIGGRQRDRVDA